MERSGGYRKEVEEALKSRNERYESALELFRQGHVKAAIKLFNAGVAYADGIVLCEEMNYEARLAEVEDRIKEPNDQATPLDCFILQLSLMRAYSNN